MAKLQSSIHPKLNEEVLDFLQQRKVFTVISFILESREKLLKITKLSYKDIMKIRRGMSQHSGGKNEDPEKLLYQGAKKLFSTGTASLDQSLEMGLRFGHIHELCGFPASGKTQLCLLLAVNITLELRYNVHYIDSRGNFSAIRIHSILEAIGVSNEEGAEVMSRIRVNPVKTIQQLLNILHNWASRKTLLTDNANKFIIIDSLPQILHDENENLSGLYHLNYLANICRYLSNEFDISIVTVNFTSHWQEARSSSSAIHAKRLKMKPILGKFWRRVPNSRFSFGRTDDENRNVWIWKSIESIINSKVRIDILTSGILLSQIFHPSSY